MMKNLKNIAWNIITSNLSKPYEIEPLRKIVLINIITLAGFSILLILATIALLQNAIPLFLIDAIFSAILIALFINLRITKKIERIALIGTILTGMFFFILLAFGGVNNTAYVWTFIYPLISLFLLGSKKGALTSFTLFGIINIVFLFGNTIPFFTTYDYSLILRFIPAYFIIFVFAYVMESVREKVQDQLTNSNINLKKAHDHLNQFNQKLESKVRERTNEVERLLKQKDDFINQLGHDLKNPLGPPISLLPLLKDHITDKDDKEMLEIVHRNIVFMKNLVQKTLQLAQLYSPNTSFQIGQHSLPLIVKNVLLNNQYIVKENDITINTLIPNDMLLYADKIRMEEVFNNILNNAVKYSPKGTTIDIKAKKDNTKITVSIHDQGIGMTKEQLNHIFEEFYKADESRHDFDSSGLGMPICKRIIEKHGGTIWAESEGINKGTTMFFTLPTIHSRKEDMIIDSYEDIAKKIDTLVE